MSCTNNLKQWSLALQNYHDTNSMFPTLGAKIRYNNTDYDDSYSVQARLLPFVEQAAISESINYTMPLWGTASAFFGNGGTTEEQAHYESIVSLLNKRFPMLYCPSDAGEPVFTHKSGWSAFGGNYVVNMGSGTGTFYNVSSRTDGLFYIGCLSDMASILDGTSNTVALSESNLGKGLESHTGKLDPSDWNGFMLRDTAANIGCPTSAGGVEPDLYDYAVNWAGLWRCDRQYPWVSGRMYVSGFTAFQLPNDKSPDFWISSNIGYYAARSSHSGGVNVGMADGSVRFVSGAIDLTTWRAASTIADGESGGL